MKNLLKQIIHHWPWPLTQNEKYDRQTKAVIKHVCAPDSICIDVGCFKGEILREMIAASPQGRHFAFEPIPDAYTQLVQTFGKKATVFPFALGQKSGETTFHYVVSNPTYSGIRQRKYKGEETIKKIKVQVRTLDEMIPPELPIRLIKIDVEGGEYDVMKGGLELLKKWKPYIIFEHGTGGADMYGVNPGQLFNMLTGELPYRISLMEDFLKDNNTGGFTRSAFEDQFNKGLNCYFIAH